MTTTLVLLCVSWVTLAAAWDQKVWNGVPYVYNLDEAEKHFENFLEKYERNYENEMEKQTRFEIFKENLERINRLNKNSKFGVHGITPFLDMSREEFNSKMNGLSAFHDDPTEACKYLYDEDIPFDDAPDSYDWRDHGVVTPVKDQGMCGSCYAFSAIGNIESQNALKTHQLLRLSEQQIVDCDQENDGCGGGLMNVAMRSLIDQGGVESEADYPYEEISKTCNFDANKVKVKLAYCLSFNLTSQEKLKQLVYHSGPIAIGIQGSGLQTYVKGIISDDDCDIGGLNHGVLLVGYGSEDGVPYWIVKNSWGTIFGEDGYFRMHRGDDSRSCSVMNDFMATAVLA
ncbi:hypothetical protein PYW08_000724 [Mythimna loreyi]|uniref:Uncharacterized protein n=1 Tax=Mythimna loreyi TaxID=667449 RepID=A0ACC2R2M5_9NEOP|nr:hypothetical protein PYW08_000724 [Mythimna loreyi]